MISFMSVKQYIYCEDVANGYEYHRYTVSRLVSDKEFLNCEVR